VCAARDPNATLATAYIKEPQDPGGRRTFWHSRAARLLISKKRVLVRIITIPIHSSRRAARLLARSAVGKEGIRTSSSPSERTSKQQEMSSSTTSMGKKLI
jgi:hypothetical protein